MAININITVICSSLNELTMILEHIKSNYPEILIQVSPIDADGARGKEQGPSDSPSTSTGALSPQPSARSVMSPSDSLGGVPADLATLKTPVEPQYEEGSTSTNPPSSKDIAQQAPTVPPKATRERIPPTERQLGAVHSICLHREGAQKRLDDLMKEKGVKVPRELDLDDIKDFIELYPYHPSQKKRR
jgi:hypothetical protein